MRKLIMLPLLLALLTCCSGIPTGLTCEEVNALRLQISRKDSIENLRTTIAQNYRISSESITVDDRPLQQGQLLQWHSNGLSYNMSIQDSTVVQIGVSGQEVTAAAVMACLGQPSHYSAMYGYETAGGTQLSLNLLFPETGVLAGGAKILSARPAQPPAISADFPINGFQFMEPRSADVLLEEAHRMYATALRQQLLAAYKPWPGSWERLQITQYVSPP